MADSLGREDIISGLRDLVGELHAAGEVAGIRLAQLEQAINGVSREP